MFRYLMLAVLVIAGALNAHAWETLNDKNFDSTVRDGGCVSKTDFERCVSARPIFVRTDEGPSVKRYLLASHGVTTAELEAMLDELGVSTSVYVDYVWDNEGGRGRKHIDSVAEQTVLFGLMAEDGTTELAPPIYKKVWPVSDKLILVRRLNLGWGFITPGDPASFRALDFPWDNWDWYFGNQASLPSMIMFRSKSITPGLLKYTVINTDGEPSTTIDRVKPTKGDGKPFAINRSGYLGFPVRTEDGADTTVFLNVKTRDIERADPTFEFVPVGWRITGEYDLDVGRKGFTFTPMKKVGTISSGHGIISGGIYRPLDDWDSALKPNPEADEQKIIGIVPIYLPDEYQNVRGWITVHGDDTRRWYKLVAHAPEEDARGKDQVGEKDELDPKDIIRYAKYFPPVADIWIGSADAAKYREQFKDADPRDVPPPEQRVVVRLFDDPDHPETSGMTDWVSTGNDLHRRAIEKAYDTDISTLKTHPSDPQALITNGVILTAVVNAGQNKDDREYREMTPAQRQAREAQREANYQAVLERVQISMADEILQSGRSVREYVNFYAVAKKHGGKYLRAYWREYGHLPDIADSGEICNRFGQNSEECRLVWPKAQAYYAEEKAKADREAQRYAREQADRRPDPNWNRPSKSKEPRCYNNYDGTETCFSD